MVNDIEIEKLAGLSSSGTWTFCDRNNGTYLDCPINELKLEEGAEYFVAMHNPSSLNLKTAQISVPNGNFKVEEWVYGSQSYASVENVDVFCNADKAADQSAMINCQMFWEI